MLQNARVRALTVSKLLRENQQRVKLPPYSPRLGLRFIEAQFKWKKKKILPPWQPFASV